MKTLLASVILCSLLFCALIFSCKAANDSEVSSKISEAENALRSAFETVTKAEQLGANTTDLVNQLRSAGELLNEADTAYKTGDLDTALSKADQSLNTSNQVFYTATSLFVSFSAEAQRTLLYTVAFSAVGIIMFLIALILIWLWFSRRYNKNLLRMKVEVS